MENKKKSLVKGAAILGLAGIVVKLIGAIYRIPLTNIVGVKGMSYYEVAYPYYTWLLVISSAGLPTAISKLVSERAVKHDYRGAYCVFRVAFWLLIIIGTATSVLMLVLSDTLAEFSGLPGASYSFAALAPSLLVVSVMCAYRGFLQGLQDMMGTAISQVAEQAAKLIAGFALASLFMPRGEEYAAMGALIGVSISELVALISIYVMFRRRRKSLPRNLMQAVGKCETRKENKAMVRQLFRLAAPITIGASIMPLTGIADSALILKLLQSGGATFESAQESYSILRSNVITLVNMPVVLTAALAISLVPAMSQRRACADRLGVQRLSKLSLKIAFLVGAPCTVGFFVLAEPLLSLLYTRLTPEQLTLAAALMRTSSIGVLFLSVVQPLTGALQGLGRPMLPVTNLLIGGILKIATMFILMRIPGMGIQGAALSSVICYAVAAVLDVVCLLRVTHTRFDAVNVLLKPLAAAIIMGMAARLVYGTLSGIPQVLAIITAICAAAITYAVCVVFFKTMNSSDLLYIPGAKRLARKIRGG